MWVELDEKAILQASECMKEKRKKEFLDLWHFLCQNKSEIFCSFWMVDWSKLLGLDETDVWVELWAEVVCCAG